MRLKSAIGYGYIMTSLLCTLVAVAVFRPPQLPAVAEGAMNQNSAEALVNNEQDAEQEFRTLNTRVSRGSTLLNTLRNSGLTFNESMNAISSLESVINMRRIQAGQEVSIDFSLEGKPVKVSLPLNYDHTAVSVLQNDRWTSSNEIRKVFSFPVLKRAVIETSLYSTANDSSIPIPVMMNAIELFSFSFDFEREIKSGDKIELLYLLIKDENGETLASGDILFARLHADGRSVEAWRYERSEGGFEYYNSVGQSIRKDLLKTPVSGSRITSQFGFRNHPIFGYTALHRGIDFAAAVGTPVKAAGDGVIIIAGWHDQYGYRVKIRHPNHYETMYAHLSSIKSGIVPGTPITQGRTIGFSGNTGASTGPHIHYEVHYYGKPIDPTSLKFPPSHTLEENDVKQLKQKIKALDAKFAL